MLAILRVDASGRILAADERAAALGASIGSRCCDVVLARSGREVRCEPTCALRLARGTQAVREQRVVVQGRVTLLHCSALGDEIVVILSLGGRVEGGEALTPREREVLELLARGVPTVELARRLRVSPGTVRTHAERARNKLGARTRAEAVAIAIARGELGVPALESDREEE